VPVYKMAAYCVALFAFFCGIVGIEAYFQERGWLRLSLMIGAFAVSAISGLIAMLGKD
jgi:hypothetical protein